MDRYVLGIFGFRIHVEMQNSAKTNLVGFIQHDNSSLQDPLFSIWKMRKIIYH